MSNEIQILEVVNGDAHHPIVFSCKLDNGCSLNDAIEMFFKENGIEDQLTDDVKTELQHALRDSDVYWHDELYCFQMITI